MYISELYQSLVENVDSDNLNGELELQGNCIVWTYNLEDNAGNEQSLPIVENDEYDDEYDNYYFESETDEEILQTKCDEDIEIIKLYLDDLDDSEDWSFSEPEIGENTIMFRIF